MRATIGAATGRAAASGRIAPAEIEIADRGVYLSMDRMAAAVLCVIVAAPSPREPPLPEARGVLADVRQRLEAEPVRQNDYAYVETRRERHLDSDGRVKRESVKVFEIHPGLPGEAGWKRLVSEDGQPIPAGEMREQERERQEQVEEYLQRFARDPQAACEAHRQELDRWRRKRAELIGEVFRVFDLQIVGREVFDGRDTLVFTLAPRPGAQPRTRYGRIMTKLAGRAWISEADRELVRLDVEAIDTISIAFGVVARVHKGSRASYQRVRVDDDTWLPARLTYSASARLGIVRLTRRVHTTEYSNYRRSREGSPVSCARES